MSDNPAPSPDQPANPGQQPTGNPAATPPEGFVEKARFDGLVRKVEELTLANRSLNDQLTHKSSEAEQLKGQLAVKDTEKQVAVGERDKSLQTALQENATLQSELKELRGLQLKLQVAKELNRPELLKIMDRIPALEDAETLKTVMQDFVGFADDLVKQREQQLMAGITPGAGGGNVTPAAPATAQAWEEHINGLTLGSPERMKALNEYGDWLERQHTNAR